MIDTDLLLLIITVLTFVVSLSGLAVQVWYTVKKLRLECEVLKTERAKFQHYKQRDQEEEESEPFPS